MNLNFLNKYEDKVAFKKAVNELNSEASAKKGTVTRVYHNENLNIKKEIPNVDITTKDAPDVKYFKDWKSDEVLEPGNHETIIDYDKFEEEERKKQDSKIVVVPQHSDEKFGSNESDAKKSFIDMLDERNNLRPSGSDFSDFESYIRSRRSANTTAVDGFDNNTNKNNNFDTNSYDRNEVKNGLSNNQKTESLQTQKDRQEIKDTLNQILRTLTSSNEEKTVAKKNEESVEIKPIVAVKKTAPKTSTQRRTRGKGKRKYDKDVVKFVDWRD
ncbi:MAG: hypothetical protein IJS74_01345 [Clostridia bacterium]|nr:hypothetical protein [Clostridia bacterium]